MFDPHVGQDFIPCPQIIHATTWPHGTNATARCLVEHIIHRLVAVFVDGCCDEELGDNRRSDFVSDSSLLDVLDDSILMQL